MYQHRDIVNTLVIFFFEAIQRLHRNCCPPSKEVSNCLDQGQRAQDGCATGSTVWWELDNDTLNTIGEKLDNVTTRRRSNMGYFTMKKKRNEIGLTKDHRWPHPNVSVLSACLVLQGLTSNQDVFIDPLRRNVKKRNKKWVDLKRIVRIKAGDLPSHFSV